MATSMGDIVIELNREKAPISVENFLAYADKGFYENTIFHRVVPGFVVQGGGFDIDKSQKPTGDPIKNEWQNGLKNTRGTIAMARTAKSDTATSQFYFNLKDNAPLDMATPRGDNAAYAVFGTVIKGMEVVDKMAASPTGRQTMKTTGGAAPMGDVPTTDIVIKSVKRISAADAKK
jgi:cyclophilin family peptidyl-prolyl cis-trans isomerase